jgi:hypothetical protein
LVLPLIDEDKPKCFICHKLFQNMEELKIHQESTHKEFFEKYEKEEVGN